MFFLRVQVVCAHYEVLRLCGAESDAARGMIKSEGLDGGDRCHGSGKR